MFNNKLKNIDINKIQANENQPRTVFNEEKIEELAASIKENGLIQPIVVRKVNGIYQIIAGERRYRACCSLNMKQVPCIIEDYDDKQTQTLAIIENIQREDLSPLEEAKAYQALIKEYGNIISTYTIAVCIKTDEPIKLLSFIKSEIPDVETWSDYR